MAFNGPGDVKRLDTDAFHSRWAGQSTTVQSLAFSCVDLETRVYKHNRNGAGSRNRFR